MCGGHGLNQSRLFQVSSLALLRFVFEEKSGAEPPERPIRN